MSTIQPTRVFACGALVLVIAAMLNGQQLVYFPQPTLPGNAEHDVNGDGLPDAVGPVGYGGQEHVTVRFGHGNGAFGPPTIIPSPISFLVLMADVTGDGQVDVVAQGDEHYPSGEFVLDVHPGDGSSFGEPIATPSPLYETPSQALADMDSDGTPDWVGAAFASGSVTGKFAGVAISDGDGGFRFGPILPVETNYNGLAVGDFDGDGLLDIALSYLSSVGVHVGLGDGSLSATPIITSIPGVSSFWGPELSSGDFEGDGISDLITVTAVYPPPPGFPAVAVVMHGELGGHFSAGESFALQAYGKSVIGDVNGDDVDDVIVALGTGSVFSSEDVHGLATVLGAGGGSFDLPLFTPCEVGTPLGLTDVDADGLVDIEFEESFVSGHGDGSFQAPLQPDLPGYNNVQDVLAADMNADGEQDLVAVVKIKQPDGLRVMLGDGAGNFAVHSPPVTGSQRITAGDIDGEGTPDLVRVTSTLPYLTTALFNDGTGTAFPTTLSAFSSGCADLQLADVDGDGNLDLLATPFDETSLQIRLGAGAGALAPAETLPLSGQGLRLAIADLDEDGLLDVAASIENGSVAFLRGLGGGNFSPPQYTPTPSEADCLLLIDIDGNGLRDLVVASAGSFAHEFHVLLAQSPFSFATATELSLVSAASDLLAADVDGDGWTDVLVADKFGPLSIFGNQGGELVLAGASGVAGRAVAVADFNDDDRPDVALADARATVLLNQLGTFPNLGYQHAANYGWPQLVTAGTPTPDTLVSFVATGAPANAAGAMFLGLQFTPQPFAGGMLVPSPDVILPMRPDVPLTGRWPELPAGTRVYAQAWFTSGGEVSATNAVEGITQP